MKKSKHDIMYERIEQHGRNVQTIFGLSSGDDPIKLSKRLHNIETKAHRLAEDYCNGIIDSDQWEIEADKILARVDKVLGYLEKNIPVFVNGDPRGYALKIRDEYVREHDLKIYRDWGGYGILAPDFRED